MPTKRLTHKSSDSANVLHYRELVQSIRKNFSLGAEHEVDAMFQVLELERWPAYWKPIAPTFAAVLRIEHLCTVSRWKSFRVARSMFSTEAMFEKKAHLLGVRAICLIAKQPSAKRGELYHKAVDHAERTQSVPTYQYVTRLLGVRKKVSGPSRSQLEKMLNNEKKLSTQWKGLYFRLLRVVQKHNTLRNVKKIDVPILSQML